MPHLHYSPFQFATAEEFSTDDVNARRLAAKVQNLVRKDTSKTQNMGATPLSIAQAASIPGTPNAFISPNPVSVMRDMKKPIAPSGLVAPKAKTVEEGHYRKKTGREHYSDRV